jgi:hypothetical protein
VEAVFHVGGRSTRMQEQPSSGITSCAKFNQNVLGAREGIKGKPVQVRRGPATVIRRTFQKPLELSIGEGEKSGASNLALPVSQETYPR